MTNMALQQASESHILCHSVLDNPCSSIHTIPLSSPGFPGQNVIHIPPQESSQTFYKPKCSTIKQRCQNQAGLCTQLDIHLASSRIAQSYECLKANPCNNPCYLEGNPHPLALLLDLRRPPFNSFTPATHGNIKHHAVHALDILHERVTTHSSGVCALLGDQL